MDDRNDERQGGEHKGEWTQNTPQEENPTPQTDPYYRRKFGSGTGRLWAGLFMLLVGGVLLLDQMGFPLPDWLFSWHILLIAIGLFIGLRHNFRGAGWLILMLIGGCFLIQDFYPKANLYRFIAPCILIFIGFIIILRPKRSWRDQRWRDDWKDQWSHKWHRKFQHEWHQNHHRWNWRYNPNRWHPGQNPGGGGNNPGGGPYPGPGVPGSVPGGSTNYGGPGPSGGAPDGPQQDTPPNGAGIPGSVPPDPTGQTNQTNQTNQSDPNQGGPHGFGTAGSPYSSEDYIDTTSIFGGVHKKVVSKNFRGGDIVTFLGGSEIDLSQAEIYGTARLDVTQVMGGTKIIVPAHWEVRSEVTALFAGFEDKRQQPAMINPNKVLIIDGTSIFGGIELKNF